MKNFLCYFRKCANLSQEELAKKSGLTQNTISSYETGQYSPTLINALKISYALGIPVSELFELERTDFYEKRKTT